MSQFDLRNLGCQPLQQRLNGPRFLIAGSLPQELCRFLWRAFGDHCRVKCLFKSATCPLVAWRVSAGAILPACRNAYRISFQKSSGSIPDALGDDFRWLLHGRTPPTAPAFARSAPPALVDGSEPVATAGAQHGQHEPQNRPLIRSGLCTTGSIGAPHFEHGPETWAVRRHIRGPVSDVSVRFAFIVSPK